MFPEIGHVQANVRVVVPVHEQAGAQQDAGHVAHSGGPVAGRGDESHGDGDVDYGREDVDQAPGSVLVLGALDFDAGVLGQWNHDRQDHGHGEPVRVLVGGAGPDIDEVPAQEDESAVQEPEQDHLVASHPGHQFGKDPVIVVLGDDAVDLGHEHVRHRGAHGEEDVPDLHRNREHRNRVRAGHRT